MSNSFRGRGSILLLSLWTTATLAALGIAQATRISLELKWVDRVQEGTQAWYLAWMGVELASDLLASDPEASWDAPRETWGQILKAPISVESGTFYYQMADEQARIALNSAPLELLEKCPGFTPEAAGELMARRDQGKLISHLGELVTLPGFKAEFLPTLEPLITVYGTGAVNLNTASVEVLTLLGFSSDLSAQIVQFRTGPDGTVGTPDDLIFPDVEQIQSLLDQNLGPLLPEDQMTLASLIGSQRLGVRSSLFRVEVEGKMLRHGISKKVVAVLERGTIESSPIVRGWYET